MNQKLIKWKQFWNNMADKNNAFDVVNRNEKYIAKDIKYVVKKLNLNKNDIVLDLCCGNGIISNKISKSCKYITGVDISEQLINRAKENIGKLKNIFYHISDALNIPLNTNSVNKIFCLTSFHYFPDYDYTEGVIRGMLRVLKPKGKILITDIPNKQSFWYPIWKLIRNNKNFQKIESIELQPTLSQIKKLFLRLKLVFRKFTNKKVESDDWLWFNPDFFLKFRNDGLNITIKKSIPKNKLLNYRIDVIMTRR